MTRLVAISLIGLLAAQACAKDAASPAAAPSPTAHIAIAAWATATPTSPANGVTVVAELTETPTAAAGAQAPAPSLTPPAPGSVAAPVATPQAIGAATPAPSPSPRATKTAAPARPIFLQVVEPAREVIEVSGATARVTVVGKTVPSAVVSVNGELIDPDGAGTFRAEVDLEDDITLIEVVASDASGRELRAQRTVVR